MTKRKNKFIFYFLILLIIYGIYCAVIIGKNWDSFFFIDIGKDRLSYLLSLGQNSLNDHFVAKMYPGIYNTLSAFFLNIFPKSFELEGYHLINFTTSFFASVGLYKLTKEILNKGETFKQDIDVTLPLLIIKEKQKESIKTLKQTMNHQTSKVQAHKNKYGENKPKNLQNKKYVAMVD